MTKYAKHMRIVSSKSVGKILRDEGFIVGNRTIDDVSAVVVVNLVLKNYQNYQNYPIPKQSVHRETSTKLDSFDSNDSFGGSRSVLGGRRKT